MGRMVEQCWLNFYAPGLMRASTLAVDAGYNNLTALVPAVRRIMGAAPLYNNNIILI